MTSHFNNMSLHDRPLVYRTVPCNNGVFELFKDETMSGYEPYLACY